VSQPCLFQVIQHGTVVLDDVGSAQIQLNIQKSKHRTSLKGRICCRSECALLYAVCYPLAVGCTTLIKGSTDWHLWYVLGLRIQSTTQRTWKLSDYNPVWAHHLAELLFFRALVSAHGNMYPFSIARVWERVRAAPKRRTLAKPRSADPLQALAARALVGAGGQPHHTPCFVPFCVGSSRGPWVCQCVCGYVPACMGKQAFETINWIVFMCMRGCSAAGEHSNTMTGKVVSEQFLRVRYGTHNAHITCIVWQSSVQTSIAPARSVNSIHPLALLQGHGFRTGANSSSTLWYQRARHSKSTQWLSRRLQACSRVWRASDSSFCCSTRYLHLVHL